MIVDAHVYLNNVHRSAGRPTVQNVRELFEKMAEHGIDHAVVHTSYRVDDDHPSIEAVADLLAKDPRTTLVEGLRWRTEPRTDLFELEQRIAAGLVRGIKLYPGYEPYAIHDPSLETVMRIAAKHDVPVLLHTGDTWRKDAKVRLAHPLLVDDLAVDYPSVRFVMCHLGNPWFQDAAEVLYKNDNVFADISGLILRDFDYSFEGYVAQRLKEMILYMGDPGKQLLFGSAWPLVRMGPYLQLIDDLGLSAEQKESVLWRTACKLFRIEGPTC